MRAALARTVCAAVVATLPSCGDDSDRAAGLHRARSESREATIVVVNGVRQAFGLALDAAGNVYVPSLGDGVITKLSPELRAVARMCGPEGTWRPVTDRCPEDGPRFRKPHAVTVDRAGRLYVAEYGGGRVLRFDADGRPAGAFGDRPDRAGRLRGPVAAWPTDTGDILIADAMLHAILRYRDDGVFTGWLGAGRDGVVAPGFTRDGEPGREAAQPGGFSRPHLVRYAPDGALYVCDTGNHRIQRFDGDGVFTGWLGAGVDGPGGGWRRDGVPHKGWELGAFAHPISFEFDAAGALYVLENENSRIQRFTPDGMPQGWYGRAVSGVVGWHTAGPSTAGDEPGALRFPYDLRWHQGAMYVADTHNERIQVIAWKPR